MRRREFVIGLGAGALLAQEQQPDLTIRTQVSEVIVPVTVLDRDDQYVNGLEAKDFRLFDNKREQTFKLDVSYVPISMVVAVQANSDVEIVLPQIKKIGPLLEALVLGPQGEAAILAFDHRKRLLQDFTNDGKLFTKALDSINPGSSTSAMIDAMGEGVRLLNRRPKNNKRILLLISETRDNGSEGRLREVLNEAQFKNVIVYTININRALTMLTKKMPPPRQDHLPAGARPVPPGAPMTPSTTEQITGYRGATFNIVPVIEEIFTQVKGIFISNPAEVMTRYTGGREYSFINQRTLEQTVSKIGEELHSQYILTYTPNNLDEPGWHSIVVEVAGRRGFQVRAKDGYYTAGGKPNGR
jgi:VWFA-related protein